MSRWPFILFLVSFAVLAVKAPVFADDSSLIPTEQKKIGREISQGGTVAANAQEFLPDGLARDVFNLMTGIERPLDDSTSVTIQAGKGLKIGLTF